MQSLNTLYFPETRLSHHLRNCLLLLPDTLHLLQPVESSISQNNDLSGTDMFMEEGICQEYCPSPLGKDRDRFLNLITEIKTGKDRFAEQLSNLTLANLSAEHAQDDRTHQGIMTTLLDDSTNNSNESKQDIKKTALWQARLVLALAEILDKEESELATTLADIDDDELALFQKLKGELDTEETDEDENPIAELIRIKAKLNQPRPGTLKRRFQAWKTLYASGTASKNFWFWITSQEEAAELLISDYETQEKRNTVPLLLLDLPAHIHMRDKDAFEKIRAFQTQAMEVRQQITEKLTSIVSQKQLTNVDPVALLPDAGILARDWNDIVEYHFPEKQFGRKKLDLQFLANISLDQLVKNTKKGDICHSVLGIYKD